MSVAVVDPPEVEQRRLVRKATVARRKRLVRRGGGCLLWLAGISLFVGAAIWLVVRSFEQADQRIGDEALARAKAAGYPLKQEEVDSLVPIGPEIAETTRLWREAMAKIVASPKAEELEKMPLILDHRMDGGKDPPDRDARGRLQGEDLVRATEFSDRFREAIEAAHAARESGTVANFAVDAGPNEQPAYRFQALGWILNGARLDAEARFAHGDVDGALRSLRTTIAIDRALAAEPYAWLWRHGWSKRTFDAIERTLAVESLDDEQLRTLGEEFEADGEAAALRLAIARARSNFAEQAQLEGEAFLRSLQAPPAPWSRGADLAKGLDYFGEIDAASERGLLAAAEQGKAISDELTAALATDPTAPKRYPATYVLVPRAIDLAASHQRAEVQKALARTGIACERYRLAHDSLPAKLDDLVPEYLPAVPVDPFDEQSLRYVSDKTGVRLYSVGPDKTDEGGGAAVGYAAAAFAASDVVFRLKKSRAVATPETSDEAECP